MAAITVFRAKRNCTSAAKENKIIIHLVCGNRKITTCEHYSKNHYGNRIFLKINEIKDLSDLFVVGIFTYDTIC